MNRRERRRTTGASSRKSSNETAPTAAALHAAGLSHFEAGQHLDAQLCCQQALALDPDHADTLHLMGVLCLRAQQPDHAVAWLIRAIRKEPKAEYLSSLGSTLRRQGRLEDALKTFDKAVQLKPDDSELWCNLAQVLAELKRPADAVLALQHALKLDTRNWDAAEACGILLHELRRLEEALACFSRCNELRGRHAPTLYRRGHILSDLQRRDEALGDLETARTLDPQHPGILNSLGHVLQALGRHGEALTAFDQAVRLHADYLEALNGKAISLAHFRRFEEALALLEKVLALRPDYSPARINKALWLTELHRFDDAIDAYDQVGVHDPGNADAEYSRSFLHLLIGNFEAGWAGREARWRAQARETMWYPDFPEPRWLGRESIAGKTVLIYAEEGLGDTIQFARYIPMVAALGARIILVVGEPVRALLAGLPCVSQCLAKPLASRPEIDFHCTMSSLPLIFGTRLDSIPSGISFQSLIPPAMVQAWQDRLGACRKPRVGLVWSGRPQHYNDHNRSTSLRALSPILETGATFISLQKEPRPEDKAALLERGEIVDLTEHLTDFVSTAALISCLDLLITVDTSVAHMAAALGRSTWIMLPYTPDFRWLLDRNDSPWYPSVRLFRQSEAREYADVIARIRAELTAFVAAAAGGLAAAPSR